MEPVTARYAEVRNGFVLWVYNNNTHTPQVTQGTMTQRPAWLVTIANAARLGGHMADIPDPPPDRVVWFDIDASYNLVEFKNF